MRATLYEALAIPREASDAEVRAALRGRIRKYYAKTRDGQGNVEEALRFINHASRILTDPELRAQYDQDLAASDGTVDERISHVVNSAVAYGGRPAAPAVPPRPATPTTASAARRAATAGADARKGQHPGLTEQVARRRPSAAVAVTLCVLFGAFIAVAIALTTPADAVPVAKQVLLWLTALLLALAVVYGVVHGVAWSLRRAEAAVPVLEPPGDLAILNWRRHKTVFLGTNEPQEDASWVFQLRMSELERAKLGRTSEPRPWSRLGARMFDYALWGLMLAVPLSELRGLGVLGPEMAFWLGHPLVAPTLITATWIPLEAALIALTHTTPGKWLFGVYLQFSISDAYASRDGWTQFRRALARAWRVWWQGMACGVPLLAPILIAIAYEKIAEYQETPWDFAEDCLVTHGPVAGLNAVTGVAGLAAMFWLYGIAWHQPMGESIDWARTTVAEAIPSPAEILHASLWQHAPPGADAASVAPGAATPPRPIGTARIMTAKGSTAADSTAPIDPQLAALFAERQKRVAVLSTTGPRRLDAGQYRQAAEICREWVDLELGNAKAWRCLGRAEDALGNHREAVAAFRKAKQYDPDDPTIDRAINRSQRRILADFLNRRGN